MSCCIPVVSALASRTVCLCTPRVTGLWGLGLRVRKPHSHRRTPHSAHTAHRPHPQPHCAHPQHTARTGSGTAPHHFVTLSPLQRPECRDSSRRSSIHDLPARWLRPRPPPRLRRSAPSERPLARARRCTIAPALRPRCARAVLARHRSISDQDHAGRTIIPHCGSVHAQPQSYSTWSLERRHRRRHIDRRVPAAPPVGRPLPVGQQSAAATAAAADAASTRKRSHGARAHALTRLPSPAASTASSSALTCESA